MHFGMRNAIALLATLGVGLLAGILVGTGMTAFTTLRLTESSWVMQFQFEDQLFAKAMPPVMLGTLLALAAACFLTSGQTRLLFGAAIVFMLLVLAVTIGFEVPLNKQIQSWTPGSAPPAWQHVRDLWLKRHLLRTVASVLSFLSALASLALR